jgi:GNAT superfamily N-acetyltransferase
VVRPAVESDVESISALIQSVMHLFFSGTGGTGADKFIASTAPHALKVFIEREDIAYFVGHIDGEFCGAVAIRSNKHLQHLFVTPNKQYRGIGTELWQYAKNATLAKDSNVHKGEFTVNASTNAVPFYAKLGFSQVGELQKANGIVYQAMALNNRKQHF